MTGRPVMDRFRFRAATDTGRIVEGVLQAVSRSGALEELRRQQLVPVDVAPVADAVGRRRRRTMARGPALAVFSRTVATMLGAGVTVDRAVGFAGRQAGHPAVAAAARDVHDRLQGGESLADALGKHPDIFGPVFCAMVAAGEESGALDEAMARVADHEDEVTEIRSEIRSALVYPALMTVATGAGIILLLLFIVPRFAAMIMEEGGTLPLSTRALVNASRVAVNGWWLLILGPVSATIGARAWLRSPGNRRAWHAWRLRLPLAGELEEKYATARFSRALGMLLGSGRPILSSLDTARASVSNAALGADFERAMEAVSHGQSLHAALADALPPLANELIAVGEESGRLDEMCMRIAESYDAEVRRSIRTLVAIIEPAMILFFGVIVGFVALAMLQAIYGIRLNPF